MNTDLYLMTGDFPCQLFHHLSFVRWQSLQQYMKWDPCIHSFMTGNTCLSTAHKGWSYKHYMDRKEKKPTE